jgi:hypothetical protein
MKRLFNTRKKETDQDQNEENAPENGDRPSKNSTAEQKRERQGKPRAYTEIRSALMLMMTLLISTNDLKKSTFMDDP